jgi:hypothetical protein
MSFARVAWLFFATVLAALPQSSGLLTITSPSPLLPAALGQSYSQSLVATGGFSPYTWALISGALPTGLSISPTGVISGTPEAAGASTFSLKVTDTAGGSATQTFSISVISVSALSRFGALSHIAAGGWWDTTITVINTSTVPAAISVVFRSDNGTALSLPFKLTQQTATQGTGSSVNALVNPTSGVLIETGALPNTVVGWADVMSSGPVGGFAIMRSSPPNDKASEATVPLQNSSPSSVTIPFDNTSGYVMGVALANLAVGSAIVNATVWDENGSQLGVQQILLPGNGHVSFALADRVSLTNGKRGIVQFQNTSGGIAGLGLRFSPAGTFTDVPVLSQQ